jgi:hypothetical protein
MHRSDTATLADLESRLSALGPLHVSRDHLLYAGGSLVGEIRGTPSVSTQLVEDLKDLLVRAPELLREVVYLRKLVNQH